MEEKSKSPEEQARELTPEELSKVAGGVPAVQQQHEEGWIEINSFQWGGGGE